MIFVRSRKCGVDTSKIKAICTLALATSVWPNAEAHNISALIYMITKGSEKAREMIKKAHRADMDIILTANILMHEVHQLTNSKHEELYTSPQEEARIPHDSILVNIAVLQLLTFLPIMCNGY